jgi:hypothetical protein
VGEEECDEMSRAGKDIGMSVLRRAWERVGGEGRGEGRWEGHE